MYDLIPVFLFSFSANIDSFIIGISYGLRKTKIRPSQNLFIAFITLCGTLGALLFGSGIQKLFTLPFTDSAGSLILLALGVYYLLKFLIPNLKNLLKNPKGISYDAKREHHPDRSDDSAVTGCRSHSMGAPFSETYCYASELPSGSANVSLSTAALSWKETLLLGISLSANNLGIGIGASIAGLHVLPTAPVSFTLSMLFLYLGNLAGRSQLFQKAGQYADLFCGLLLIILGVCQ